MEQMANSLDDLEELALCSCCKRVYDEIERPPKILSCKHYFCLPCTRSVLEAGQEVRCLHCWKRTELPEGRADALPTHTATLALARRLTPDPPCPAHSLPAMWCAFCGIRACRACDHSHHAHALRPSREARILLQREAHLLVTDLHRLAARQRDILLRALDAATALKVRLETELSLPMPPVPFEKPIVDASYCSLTAATTERERLRALHADALLQSRLDDLIRNANIPLDFELLRRALSGTNSSEMSSPLLDQQRNPVLFLANYCMAQLYTRHCSVRRTQPLDIGDGASALEGDAAPETASPALSTAALGSPIIPHPSAYPLFYFNLEVNGAPFGRVVIEVRDDVAPRMARNFAVLATGDLGVGYRGCTVFHCWENESVITGDFELNNGRGGRSVYEESYFMPDDTKMAAVRGSVGMRRLPKRHDSLGLVGSQFRIMLREMRGFTAIFAYVVEGLELVDRLSREGDSVGKPQSSIVILNCGKIN